MPIIIPDGLSIADELRNEDHINVISEREAKRQNIRPLRFGVVNTMPKEVRARTEREIARLIGNTSLQVKMDLIMPREEEHFMQDERLRTFYTRWTEDMRKEYYDCLIMMGANVETLPWNEVHNWDAVRSIIDHSRDHATSRVFICWSSQAALKHLHGLEKEPLPEKLFGVYTQTVTDKNHPLTSVVSDEFPMPVSRATEVPIAAIKETAQLSVLAESPITGAALVVDENGRDFFFPGHIEYGTGSLDYEYQRNKAKDPNTALPVHYYPDNNPSASPVNTWRSSANALFSAIVNQTYQRTSPELQDIQSLPEKLPFFTGKM